MQFNSVWFSILASFKKHVCHYRQLLMDSTFSPSNLTITFNYGINKTSTSLSNFRCNIFEELSALFIDCFFTLSPFPVFLSAKLKLFPVYWLTFSVMQMVKDFNCLLFVSNILFCCTFLFKKCWPIFHTCCTPQILNSIAYTTCFLFLEHFCISDCKASNTKSPLSLE